jgi:hypothetical protein
MDTELIKAQHYRDQAIKMRGLAAQESDDEAKAALISLAETYEALCQKLIDRTERIP